MNFYEPIASEFDQVEIDNYDPTIWSPMEIVERNRETYKVQEPADTEVKQSILEEVEQAKKEAEDSEEMYYNGPLVRLKDHEVRDDNLVLDLQNTNYFSHIGTRRPGLEKENRADPLSVGARLVTSDNYIVLGEKSGLNEVGAGEYQLPGAGYVEDPDLQYERSLNASSTNPIHREIDEEVNLDYTQLTVPKPSDLIVASHRQPMLIYDAETTLESREVAEEWWKQENEREFSGLLFAPRGNIESALNGEQNFFVTGEEGLHETCFDVDLRPHADGALDQF